MSQEAIEKLVADKVAEALAADHAATENAGGPTGGTRGPARGAGGPATTPTVCEYMHFCWFQEMEEIQRMEQELWGLKVKNSHSSAYTSRFHELVLLCPTMVEPEYKKIKAYIRGLSEDIKGDVTSSRPANINKAVRMTHSLMEQRVKARAERAAESNKIKWENFQVRRICWISTFLQPLEVAPHWSLHCGKIGQRTRDYRGKTIATGANTQPIVTCYDHGERGHIKSQCPKRNNQQAGNARGQAYVMKDGRQQGLNVVTGTFLLNN
ncbi:putative reverse transcriptase domain-containing protein [Tanacetum coccineum]